MSIEREYISYGTPLLDLITGGGAGHIGGTVNLVGDTGSGKTLLATEILYQAKKKYGDEMSIRYLDKESSYSFDTMEMYGMDMSDCFVENVHSIEHFSADLGIFASKIKKRNYGIYVVDSFDSLCSDAELEELEERMNALEKNKDYKKASYHAEKQKYSSQFFRSIVKTLEENNVMLIILSQIRDNMNAKPFEKKYTITGGKALAFYSNQRLFLKTCDKEQKEGRQIGYTLHITALKSRCKYPAREMVVNLTSYYGMDNISTCVDYLYDLREDYGKLKVTDAKNVSWREDSIELNADNLKEFLNDNEEMENANNYIASIKARRDKSKYLEYIQQNEELMTKFVDHFGVVDRETLIKHIVANNLEQEITNRAVKKWLDIEEKIKPVRPLKRL